MNILYNDLSALYISVIEDDLHIDISESQNMCLGDTPCVSSGRRGAYLQQGNNDNSNK
jgi:hypothetical protein